MGWSKVSWGATCTKHGVQEKGGNTRWVKVGVPKGKKEQKEGGCPICKMLEEKEKNSGQT